MLQHHHQQQSSFPIKPKEQFLHPQPASPALPLVADIVIAAAAVSIHGCCCQPCCQLLCSWSHSAKANFGRQGVSDSSLSGRELPRPLAVGTSGQLQAREGGREDGARVEGLGSWVQSTAEMNRLAFGLGLTKQN